MKIEEILKITKGKLLSGDISAEIDPALISTDSRNIKKGEFFLPLKGSNFDGEEFIGDVFKKGAIGTFTTHSARYAAHANKIIVKVSDTTLALQKIAHHHRMKYDIPVIGVTGSNGKTTTKDMISQVLSKKFNILKNEGTKNNHIGLPQTLLKLNKKHDICVLEMGTNHKGEIRLLADIARPGIVVITNIGPSHLKFLKDLKGVFEAKKEIFEFLGKDGLAVVNGDDKYLSEHKGGAFKIVKFGFDERNDFRASLISAGFDGIEFLLNDSTRFTLNVLGTHNTYNALAAIALARHFKLSFELIRKGLAEYKPTYMRLNIKEIGGLIVIDDSYNSNPSSMVCALQTMKDLPARSKWVVSADMLELGLREDYFHRMVGESVAKLGFKGLLTYGSLSQHTYCRALECGMDKENIWHCSTRDQVADILRKVAKKGDAILVKGSRAMKMEEIIEKLKA
ncbi:MAG: UDP-N-acetylmuramoyl-tripeptide--D-alanyl-D-alanine ligase [Candidatus Omnitrophota bacterium]|nr:UDP-N-acetylmuramoyl-tripeptide--D-alanyl-D-alanine ligase [Candidatus Omnitrophota bacterium]